MIFVLNSTSIEEIHFTDEHNKDHDGQVRRKVDICKTLKLKRFIEDGLRNAIECASICEQVYLIDYLWNKPRPKDFPKNITIVKDIQQVLEYL